MEITTTTDLGKLTFSKTLKDTSATFSTITPDKYEAYCLEHGEAYELIFDSKYPDRPVKLILDFDLGAKDCVDENELYPENLTEYIIEESVKMFEENNMTCESITQSSSASYFCSKSKSQKWKVSAHFVFNTILGTLPSQKYFVENVLNPEMKNKINDIVAVKDTWNWFDENIYKTNQRMRSTYCSKKGEHRPLTIVKGTFQDSVVTAFIPEGENHILQPPEQMAKIVFTSSTINHEVNDAFIQKYLDYVRIISKTELSKYAVWYKFQRASANLKIPFEIYDNEMKNCDNYNQTENQEYYEKPDDDKNGRLGFNYIKTLAEKCNPTAKALLDEKYSFTFKGCHKSLLTIAHEAKMAKEKEKQELLIQKLKLKDEAIALKIKNTNDKLIQKMEEEQRRQETKALARLSEINKMENDNTHSFEKVAGEFEKTHAKIVNKGVFIKELETDVVVMGKVHLKTAYENMIYQKVVETGNEVKYENHNFINDWLINNPSQRKYDDVGVYPNKTKCPDNIYNMWRPFAMEYITEYEPKEAEMNVLLNHIRILCGNEEHVYDYFIKWIAQMIQFPEVKSICPTLISNEGAGKGTLMRLLGLMLGSEKVFETSTPSRDVWGDFNGRMCNTFLLNLNELSKKETTESEGKIKALITDPKLTINNKGVNQYDIQSYHRFIITTNHEDPIKTTTDERRKIIIRSSDEKCGNKEYFANLYKILDDVNVIKTCYEYFKGIPDMENFGKIELVSTEYQNNLKTLSISPIETWLKAFTMKHHKEEEIELLGENSYKQFVAWCAEFESEYKINLKQFGVRLTNLRLKGIVKGKHTNRGETKIFKIKLLKEHFRIGCLIDVGKDEDDVLDEEKSEE